MPAKVKIDPDQLTARYIRPYEWEAITGMTIWQAYRALKAGTLKGVKVGAGWYIDAGEISDYFVRNGKRTETAA